MDEATKETGQAADERYVFAKDVYPGAFVQVERSNADFSRYTFWMRVDGRSEREREQGFGYLVRSPGDVTINLIGRQVPNGEPCKLQRHESDPVLVRDTLPS